jgi:predicted nucleotidyltransferase
VDLGHVGVLKRKIKRREEMLAEARSFADCIIRVLPNSAIIVSGSTVRGDFTE